MLHNDRTWQLTEVDDRKELAQKLITQTWTGCTGFCHDGVLFLNDSTSPNGAQEYAAVNAETGEQLESITFGWVDQVGRAVSHIRRCVDYTNGEADPPGCGSTVDLDEQIEAAEDHGRCELCR